MITEDRKALFQGELEPIAAGYPVTRPVVEVLVGNNALDLLEGRIGGGIGMRQYRCRIEDVEPLVLHGAHIEIVDRYDHEQVEVVFTPVGLFVPAHGTLERRHGMLGLAQILLFHPDLQSHLTTTGGGEAVFDFFEVTRYQGKQIARLGKGVVPGNKVPAIRQFATLHRVAIGEQYRLPGGVAYYRGGERRHHIGTIREISDPAKALGLTLGAIDAVGKIQPFQGGIFPGSDLYLGFQTEAGGRVMHGQPCGTHGILLRPEGLTINGDGLELELLALKFEWLIRFRLRSALKLQLRLDPRCHRIQLESQLYLPYPVGRRLIIVAVGWLGFCRLGLLH